MLYSQILTASLHKPTIRSVLPCSTSSEANDRGYTGVDDTIRTTKQKADWFCMQITSSPIPGVTKHRGSVACTRASYWAVPGSSFGPETGYPNDFRGFPQSLIATAGIVISNSAATTYF
jgi:hypothetical protein